MIVFAAMGVTNDVAGYFRRSFEESGVMEKVVMYQNLSNDPIIERILTPRVRPHRRGVPGVYAGDACAGDYDRYHLLL